MKKMTQLVACLLLAFSVSSLYGQDEEGKIVIEITKDVNGEKKTFKGEYNSTEEMHADPNYQEFAGDQDQFHFWSDDGDVSAFFHSDHLKDMQKSLFKFFDGEEGSNAFFFHDDDGSSFNFQFDHFDSEEFSEELHESLKDLGIEIDELVDQFSDEDGDRRIKMITMKSIRVSDDVDDFGKKGAVSENNQLELDDLKFYPNPSKNGKLKIRFTTPEEGALRLKVSNLEGKEVFSRSFDRFSGLYSETIDLSGQEEGIYLLEIAQGKKRFTKKLVVE